MIIGLNTSHPHRTGAWSREPILDESRTPA
jgi:hypothetical protein